MLAIGSDELEGRPQYQKGTRIKRVIDGKVFSVEVGTNSEGKETNMLGFIKDGEDSFMVGCAGSLLPGWEIAPEEDYTI